MSRDDIAEQLPFLGGGSGTHPRAGQGIHGAGGH